MSVWLLGEERDEGEVWRSGVAGEPVDGVDPLLGGGSQHAHDPALGAGAGPGAVPAPDLAVDHSRTDGLFAAPVGGIDAGVSKEGEDRLPLVVEVGDQLAVGVVGMSLVGEQFDAVYEVGGHLLSASGAEVSGGEAILKQVLDLSGGA